MTNRIRKLGYAAIIGEISMANYEYKVIKLDHAPNEVDEQNLNALGADGWEVVSVTPFATSMKGDSVIALNFNSGGGAGIDITSQTEGVSILLKRMVGIGGYTSSPVYAPEPNRGTINNLLEASDFVKVSELQTRKELNCPGLYCIKLAPNGVLPEPFASKLQRHRIIYIGQASTSLYDRFWKQELNAIGHGTFFRSIGAVLGFLPPKDSLKGKTTRNYKFSSEDEVSIKNWLQNNVVVNCCECGVDEMDAKEEELIQNVRPLLNIAKNPNSLPELTAARNRCLEYAQGKLVIKTEEPTSPRVHGFDDLRKALLENLKMQEDALSKGAEINIACTDVHRIGKEDDVYVQFISDIVNDPGKAAILVSVPFPDDSPELRKFKRYPLASEFRYYDDAANMMYCDCGKDIEKAIMIFKRVLEEYYHVDPYSTFRYENWLDIVGDY